MTDFFAYGTLMCEDIMEEVAGYRLTGVPGIVRGYRRRSVKGEHYPALVADEKSCVEGVVYRNVPAAAWDRLDRFEGGMYRHERVKAELSDGAAIPAITYIAQPDFLDRLEETEWDFTYFLLNGKQDFQREYCGYGQLP